MIEIISPAGFEHFFRDVADLAAAGETDAEEFVALATAYGLQFGEPDWLSDVFRRYGLTLLPGDDVGDAQQDVEVGDIPAGVIGGPSADPRAEVQAAAEHGRHDQALRAGRGGDVEGDLREHPQACGRQPVVPHEVVPDAGRGGSAVRERNGGAPTEVGVAALAEVAGHTDPQLRVDRAGAVPRVHARLTRLDQVRPQARVPAQVESTVPAGAAQRSGTVRREEPSGPDDLVATSSRTTRWSQCWAHSSASRPTPSSCCRSRWAASRSEAVVASDVR